MKFATIRWIKTQAIPIAYGSEDLSMVKLLLHSFLVGGLALIPRLSTAMDQGLIRTDRTDPVFDARSLNQPDPSINLDEFGKWGFALGQNPTSQLGLGIGEKLLGRWLWKDPSGQQMMLVFTSRGSLYILVNPTDTEAMTEAVQYSLNLETQPMQMDIILNDREIIQTIFEITPEGQLNLELASLHPGDSRPAQFGDQAMQFTQISTEASLPLGARATTYPTRMNQLREEEAQRYLSALIQAQTIYHEKYHSFATIFEDFVAGIESETEFYRYNVLSVGDRTQKVLLTAQAKQPGLSSYTGVIAITQNNQPPKTMINICKTTRPSLLAPFLSIAAISITQFSDLSCPKGSESLLPARSNQTYNNSK